jgi:protein phosphatase
MLEDPQLAELLAGTRMPQEQVDDLITEANRHGGLDNITAIIVRIDSVDAAVGDATQVTQPGARPR